MKRKLLMTVVFVLPLSLAGCGSVMRAAVNLPFALAKNAGELALFSMRKGAEVTKAGLQVGEGGLDLAGGAVELVDHFGQAGHHGRMRDLQYQKALNDAGMARGQ